MKNPTWQFSRIKRLQNNCSIIEFCILADPTQVDYMWEVIGTFIIPDRIYDEILAEGIITREIAVKDEVEEHELARYKD